jgi:hypothetical protein
MGMLPPGPDGAGSSIADFEQEPRSREEQKNTVKLVSIGLFMMASCKI